VKSIETKYMEEREALLRALARLDRRSFLKVSAGALGAAIAAGAGVTPHSFSLVNVAHAQDKPPEGLPGTKAGPSPAKPTLAASRSRTSPIRICTSASSTIASFARCCARSTT